MQGLPLKAITFAVCLLAIRHVYAATPVDSGVRSAPLPTTSASDNRIQNRNVERTIDLASQNVKINNKITIVHLDKQPITSYDFVLPAELRSDLAYVSVRDGLKKELKYVESTGPHGATFRVSIPASTAASLTLHIDTVHTRSIRPFPTEIAQNERQLVRYYGSAYLYTPYETATQKTTVFLGTKNVESYTPLKPSGQSDSTLTYGPYDNIVALSTSEIVIHYENYSPFLTVTRLVRVLEVSHWGNIAVEETIDMQHTGALLKGPFSRYDFQKDSRGGQPSVKQYKTVLPASATGVYYRDTNGNISTSAMRVRRDSVELDLRPRFPLFGGWRTHYTLGYNVPSFEYLFTSEDNYVLKMRLIDHIFDDMHIDEAVVRIILPEGSHNLKLITPFPVQRNADSLHYTYLDTFGRPVVEITKRNVVERHIQEFNLKYQFSRIMMIKEPLLIVGFIFLLFLIVIIWLRLDFSITKEREPVHQHRD